ncbi:MAG: pseudaminic acid cytidylyltransferase [Parvibaculum sp.]|uniref:pseudaminic acid cytidylyltransferase n=1 Tax=Parvibaculum sp. TaxID=2024848 RepID=UPI000C5F0BC0|nr:pseudaminic acid cytidylyltransferase [Parvibaculum sp.]MAU59464.1 pseudaminic acid cytidylyltransferase [Parvibaculum sp.]
MIIAVIPARGGSKRIPRKNIRNFLGHPAIAYAIRAARECGLFDHIIVSTDDEEIAEIARAEGAEVPFMRPPEISGDHAATADVVRHAADWAGRNLGPVDFICCIYATAVFVDGEVLKRGFHEMRAAGTDYAVSVTPYAAPIERALRVTPKGRLAAVNLEAMAKRSQDIEETYHDAAQFYWGSPQAFAATQAERIARAVPVILPRYRVQDIDTEDDWMRAELMYRALFEV